MKHTRTSLSLTGSAQHDYGQLEERQPQEQDADQEHGNKIKVSLVPDIHVPSPLSEGLQKPSWKGPPNPLPDKPAGRASELLLAWGVEKRSDS